MRKVLFILGQLTDGDAEWLSNHGRCVKVPKGGELIQQGTRIDTVYIILDGAMAVITSRGMRIAQVSSGDILGEMSLVDSSLTAASVVAEQDSTVLAVSKEQLTDRLKQDVAFAARFYRALALFLADRMRNTIRRMGYGKDDPEDAAPEEELEENVLDNVHLAGARFDRMLKKLAA